jgi:glutathione S-transferase
MSGDRNRENAMRLFDFALAPNPRRVRMFLAEKSVEIPLVQINTRERAQFDESFVAINPLSMVPVLELDDGTCIAESVAICRYIEELHPEPPASEVVRNALPMFEDRGLSGMPGGVPQIPALVERGKQSLGRFFALLHRQLADNSFVAGEAFTIADITAFVTIEFAKRADVEVPERGTENVVRWHAEIASRPSAAA